MFSIIRFIGGDKNNKIGLKQRAYVLFSGSPTTRDCENNKNCLFIKAKINEVFGESVGSCDKKFEIHLNGL